MSSKIISSIWNDESFHDLLVIIIFLCVVFLFMLMFFIAMEFVFKYCIVDPMGGIIDTDSLRLLKKTNKVDTVIYVEIDDEAGDETAC